MYNRIYSHVVNNQLLYEKQFGFQQQCSTDYAILQLTKEIYESSNENKFTFGVDHKILSKKFSYFGIKGSYVSWLKSYLENRKQFVSYSQKETKMLKGRVKIQVEGKI